MSGILKLLRVSAFALCLFGINAISAQDLKTVDSELKQRDRIEGLAPLTEMTAPYHGEDGGLYGEGMNEPPESQKKAAEDATEKIQPLGKNGRPDENGKIVFLAIGMSNTSLEFLEFKRLATASKEVNPHLVIINGAQNGATASIWARNEEKKEQVEKGPNPWDAVGEKKEYDYENRLKNAGVSFRQVQVIWLKQANPGPKGEFPRYAKQLKDDIETIVRFAKAHYPNLQIIYLSSRTYAGYAKTRLNPEPYAYESAFSVRWTIQDQIDGRIPATPVLLWGPYLWANGVEPRKSDGLTWEAADFREADGTHPIESGQKKVARLLYDFLKNDTNAKTWFLKSAPPAEPESQPPAEKQ